MIVRTYSAKPTSRLTNKDAVIVGEFLDKKLGMDAPRRPAEVVQLAKPARSPIHHLFEWDDKKAAQKYRVHTARMMLASLLVVTSNGEERTTHAYHNVTVINDDGAERVYMPATVVWETPDLSSQVVANAKRDLWAFAERCREFEQLSKVVPHIEAALEELDLELV